MTVRKLKIEGSSAIFSLPYYVAQEEEYFAAEGLDIEITRNVVYWPTSSEEIELLADHKSVNAFGAFSAFENGESSLYRACEWGQIRRSHDSGRNGRVIAKRAAVASQAIIVRPGSPYNTPQDLANVAVGVSFHHGSHYLVIQTLEGFLPRDEIKVVGIKNGNRLIALRDGLVDAVAVMEPWITVADKLGFKIIAEAHYSGSEIAGPDLDAETFAAINRAVTRAVAKINADIRPYLHYFIEEVPPEIAQLEPGDFRLDRLRYVEPAPYPADAFERTYGWMVSWDLIPADAGFEQLVDNRVVASAR
jgi:NitT/TauT family transport system substrate-binding protein